MRVSDGFLLHLLNMLSVINVNEAQSCERSHVASSLAPFEEAGDGEERGFVLESLAPSLAIGSGEGSQLLILTDEVGYSFEETWQG